MRAPRIRGLLLDAGGVLYHPIGGRWNPRLDFERVLARFSPAHDPALDPARFAAAVAAGNRYLDDHAANADGTRDDYHRAVLAVLGIDDPPPALLADLNAPMNATAILEVYPDVHPVLQEVRRRGLPVAIVSDNGPGAQALFPPLGLASYIDAYAISADIGCCKPDPRMYAAGSSRIGVPPAECLFVDDDPVLVEAAIALGYQGVALGRTRPHPPASVRWIDSLHDLLTGTAPALS